MLIAILCPHAKCLADLWSVDKHSRRSGSSKPFGPLKSSSVTKLMKTLLEPDLQLRECSSMLHRSARQRNTSLYHIAKCLSYHHLSRLLCCLRSLFSQSIWRTGPPSSWAWVCSVSGVDCYASSATLSLTM